MKLRLMICAMAASTALFATDDYVGDNPVYGVLGVTDTASSNTVVGVPWVSATGGNISLSNLVSTATLAEGDIVYLYEGSTWYGYRRSAGGIWEPFSTVAEPPSPAITSPGAADQKTLTRGTGLIVQRASNTDPIYLCGRDETLTGGSTTVPAGTTMLIANPATVDKTISHSTGSTGDQISVLKNGGATDIYERRDDGWYGTTIVQVGGRNVKRKAKLDSGVAIAPGKGAWYINNGAVDTVIAW